MEYVVAKWLHILSSTLLFGTGIGSAFYLFVASLNRDPRTIAFVAGWVVIADWLFTATSIVFQPISGFYLLHLMNLPMTAPWILWSTVLYLIAAACWLPVIWIQMRLRDVARAAANAGTPLPPAYWRYFRWWTALGVPALLALIAVFYLMVAKPM